MSNPVYAHVVGDVVGKLRERFINQGVDDSFLDELRSLWELKLMQRDQKKSKLDSPPHLLPHQDGSSDSLGQEKVSAVNTPDTGTPNNLGNLKGEEEDEELNEDDDVLEQEEDEESSTNQLVLAQFVKVDKPKRSNKRKWKCALKDGILHLDLFSKADGEFSF
ncbi:transcription initiation factor IIA subunit 1-like [Papaver somniferum]|uniref:transcription initiation factor IIA subunit 1-like n=1 Tax=Papaver somniferum TaxID=3469 RepID=UPI000E6FE9D9|nr:transcription initiation factor IIA subunit 1-like [Papaver somniferum]